MREYGSEHHWQSRQGFEGVTRRREMGDDIEGACGQLRRKTLQQEQGRKD